MRLKIDQFYRSPKGSILKFKGYDQGKLVFHKYEKSFEEGPYSGWNYSRTDRIVMPKGLVPISPPA